jgi:S-phase kinase-associated protein 1
MDQEWYKEFAHALSQNKTLFEVLTAANYMNIKPLLDLACLEITFKLTGMSAEQVRVYLNLPQLTAEQEAEARERHPWIFESH